MLKDFKVSELFKNSEEAISMFLGLGIVLLTIGLIFNYFQKRKGLVNLPGVNTITGTITSPEIVKEEENKDEEYVVVRGDNLWKVAEKKFGSGYNWVDISKANNLKNPSGLAVGQKLVIPRKVEQKKTTIVEVKAEKIEGSEYVVVKGDSLWKISVRAYGDGYKWSQLWDQNKQKINNPNVLRIGTKLAIPKIGG